MWITIFSQTGSEIVNLTKTLNKFPDIIFTNQKDPEKYACLKENLPYVPLFYGSHDDLMDMLRNFMTDSKNILVTLHGYLRIIPEDICKKYKIYNGHPGAIDLYEELKGKDPQKKVWENLDRYTIIGSVVHEVTSIVDDGQIIESVHRDNRCKTIDDVYSTLKETSIESWVKFFERVKL